MVQRGPGRDHLESASQGTSTKQLLRRGNGPATCLASIQSARDIPWKLKAQDTASPPSRSLDLSIRCNQLRGEGKRAAHAEPRTSVAKANAANILRKQLSVETSSRLAVWLSGKRHHWKLPPIGRVLQGRFVCGTLVEQVGARDPILSRVVADARTCQKLRECSSRRPGSAQHVESDCLHIHLE